MNTIYCELKGYEYQVLGDMNICFFGDIGTEKKKDDHAMYMEENTSNGHWKITFRLQLKITGGIQDKIITSAEQD